MFRAFVVVLLLCSFVSASDAMFGLKWNMTKAQVQNTGAVLKMEQRDGNIVMYSCPSLPKNVSIAESYLLIFYKDSLVKLTMSSKNFTDDDYGTEGKSKFSDIESVLLSKYPYFINDDGSPMKLQISGRYLYEDPNEFYQCLDYGSSCGWWTAVFQDDNKAICLELKGLRRGTGYINMTIESLVGWSNAVEDLKNKDADAF